MLLGGFGGQGVVTLGKLAAAVAMREGREATCISSYGPEVRGGTVHCHVVISEEPIYSPIIEEADALFLFNQFSYDKFRRRLREGGLLLVNSSLVETEPAVERASRTERLLIPATEAAGEIGNVLVANVVLLGAYCAARDVLSARAVLAEMEEIAKEKPQLLEVNRRAFHKGQKLARGK
jgi:2-oxoglutarate ferredoxin oxidoreductase subunit gamma